MARLALSRAYGIGAMMIYFLAVPCAAHAHDDDVPAAPERFWLGWALFVGVTALIIAASFKARLPDQRRISSIRRRRKLRRKKQQGPG